MQGKIRWLDGVSFEAESGSGHKVIIDGPPEEGGTNAGIRPMELILLGVGGCASFDVMSILKKSRQQVTDCITQIDAQRSDSIPSVFTKIHMHFTVSGVGLKEALVKRAVSLSAEKYCSGSIMLAKAGVEITHDYEVHDVDSSKLTTAGQDG